VAAMSLNASTFVIFRLAIVGLRLTVTFPKFEHNVSLEKIPKGTNAAC
jgi:hypothetical protein